MEKTLQIHLQELREQIAQEIEATELLGTDRYLAAVIARGRHK